MEEQINNNIIVQLRSLDKAVKDLRFFEGKVEKLEKESKKSFE